TYWAFDARAGRLAAALGAAGVEPGTRVACYLYNSSTYLETLYAALKLRAVPLNVNYRYREEELVHLLTSAAAPVIVFHASLADRLERVLPRLPHVRIALQVADVPRPLVSGAVE